MQVGLNYICATAERFFAVGAVLASMVSGLAEQVKGGPVKKRMQVLFSGYCE